MMNIESKRSRKRKLRVKKDEKIKIISKVAQETEELLAMISEYEKLRIQLESQSIDVETYNKFNQAYDEFVKKKAAILSLAKETKLNGEPV